MTLVCSGYMEVKYKYAYVIMQDISNKFIEVNFIDQIVYSTSLDY